MILKNKMAVILFLLAINNARNIKILGECKNSLFM